MTEHEKRIREESNYALDNEWAYPVVENKDLRALLADLDAVRGALKRLYFAAPTGLDCNSFHHSKGEFHSHNEPCKPANEYVEAIAQAAAALKGATA